MLKYNVEDPTAARHTKQSAIQRCSIALQVQQGSLTISETNDLYHIQVHDTIEKLVRLLKKENIDISILRDEKIVLNCQAKLGLKLFNFLIPKNCIHFSVSDKLYSYFRPGHITVGAICGGWWKGSFHGTEEGYLQVNVDRQNFSWEYVNMVEK